MSGVGETSRALLEEEVSPADQLVKGVEVAARSYDVLQGLGGLSHSVNRFGDGVRAIFVGHHLASNTIRTWSRRERCRLLSPP
jgi:hypothetical protein